MSVSLERFFHLDEKHFHPLSVKNYREFLADIRKDVALDELTDEDAQEFLSDWDYTRYQDGLKSLREWLLTCLLENSEATLSVCPSSLPFWGTWGFKSLLMKVAHIKQQRQRILAAQKEMEARIHEAQIKKEAQWEQAQRECEEYVGEVCDAARRFKKKLAKTEKPAIDYPPQLLKHPPESWCDLTLPDNQQIEKWARPQVLGEIPTILRGFASWMLNHEMHVLPHGIYALEGVPCLIWHFSVVILVEARLRIKQLMRRRHFNGYTFKIMLAEQNLGSLWLEPAEWEVPESFTTPVALLELLTKWEKGDLEMPGIQIIQHDVESTVFTVNGFEDEVVELSHDFINFMGSISAQLPPDSKWPSALLKMGVIDTMTHQLIEGKIALTLYPPEPSPAEATGQSQIEDIENVVAALVALGFKTADAAKAVEGTTFPPHSTTEDKIKIILQKGY
jgi:hypothetical protein